MRPNNPRQNQARSRAPLALSRRSLVGGAAALGSGLALGGPSLSRVSAQETSITYWHHFTSESEMAGLERIMESFSGAQPEIDVTQENIPNADYMAKFTTAILGGSRPDTSMVATDRVRDMLAIDGLLDLTERINAWEGKSNVPDALWQGVTVDDKIYGVPAFMFVNWMYYRSDWFEEAGIDGPPTTWEEFRDVAIKLTDPDQGRYGFGLRGGDGGQGYLLDVIESFGSPIVNADGEPAMDKAAATEAVAFYAGLFTEDEVVPPSAPSDSYRQIMEAFRTGQTGMVLHHTGSLVEIQESLGDTFMTAPIPAGPAAHVARVAPLFNGMPSDSNADAAWEWLSYWGDTDVEIGFLEDTGYFPVSQAAAEDPRITGNPLYAAAVETLDFGSLPAQFPGSPGWSSTVALPAFQQVLLGEITPEEAVELMMDGLEEAVG